MSGSDSKFDLQPPSQCDSTSYGGAESRTVYLEITNRLFVLSFAVVYADLKYVQAIFNNSLYRLKKQTNIKHVNVVQIYKKNIYIYKNPKKQGTTGYL